MTCFLLQNNRGEFLDKSLEWASGAKADEVFQTSHRDVALNQLVELTTRDFSLRARVINCELDDRGRPRLQLHSDQSAA